MELIICVKIIREKFILEEYDCKDNIFAIVKSGSFYLSDGEKEEVINPGEGTLFLEGRKYFRKVLEPVTMYFFRFKTNKSLNVGLKMQFPDPKRIASNLELLQKLDDNFYADDFKYRRVLFDDFLMQYILANADSNPNCYTSDILMQQAVKRIKCSLHKKIDLKHIARSVNLSYVCFARHFKNYTGSTPSDFIAKERMHLACSLLQDSELLIKDIAVACGFENEYYFSNFFKKHNGISPSEFRKSVM